MKKAAYTVLVILSVMVSMASCKKMYHCSCAYNNTVVYTKDLGSHTEDDAREECSKYDTTITGEKWNCTIY
ncbi:MAG: hypothetical protein V4649_16590 [Bacteroidota bacterium]